jgi:hypothetical protein
MNAKPWIAVSLVVLLGNGAALAHEGQEGYFNEYAIDMRPVPKTPRAALGSGTGERLTIPTVETADGYFSEYAIDVRPLAKAPASQPAR